MIHPIVGEYQHKVEQMVQETLRASAPGLPPPTHEALKALLNSMALIIFNMGLSAAAGVLVEQAKQLGTEAGEKVALARMVKTAVDMPSPEYDKIWPQDPRD